MNEARQPRRQCNLCNEWSRELVEVASDIGRSFPYFVHTHEVAEMKARVKAARAEAKANKARNLAQYGQRYHH